MASAGRMPFFVAMNSTPARSQWRKRLDRGDFLSRMLGQVDKLSTSRR